MSNFNIETKCIQSGYEPGNGEPRVLPIYQSTTFRYTSSEQMGRLFDLEENGYFYTRLQNPTNDAVAAKICDLEGGVAAMLTSSGQAANFYAIMNIVEAGDHIICASAVYGGTYNLYAHTIRKMGVEATFVDPDCTEEELNAAFRENTKAVLKVHTSNYRIVGFTEAVSVESLRNLPVPVIEDLGSGALIDLKQYGLPGEPVVQEALKNGADIVCFSGDKLLGGPQAGIIVGKKCYVEQMRNNPFYRAMRIDKLTAAILERVLLEYRSESRAVQNIPVLRMITKKPMDVEQDAKRLKRMLKRAGLAAELELYPCESQVGGGSLPLTTLSSMAVAFMPYEISVEELDRRMRTLSLPVIGRIEKGKYLLDMRTFEMEAASRFIKELKEEDILRRTDL